MIDKNKEENEKEEEVEEQGDKEEEEAPRQATGHLCGPPPVLACPSNLLLDNWIPLLSSAAPLLGLQVFKTMSLWGAFYT